ncbi:MFS transporter [Rhodococcus erythropolis]|uniref:Cmx/CmrA family chloramphenicol efflux MFS transporter n=1 Tax=Rhodococcus erythropolis TaxID=1833 RepID=UPI001E3022F9|nr:MULTISPECIES: Cmx/CmrA family chloramphenicol efflux MFS transporter [Rhodococcus erythropolis group]MCD2104313.1 MFS transporter [Rhodococcus qingshengii]MCZ4523368.1 MFS transporter [Rhodococcus erythropolis]
MPFAIYVLGLAVFAQGTSEFMLSGLIPDMARDLGVSVPAAGLLTSAFAVGMIIGAPLMAIASMRWPRRRALLTFLITFMLVHVIGALTSSFEVLLVTRIVGALANAGFLAVALGAAMAMVPADMKGRATSVLLGGVTIACVAGVPGGAFLGEMWGWRAAFWAVVVISAPAVVAIMFATPAEPPTESTPNAKRELSSLRSRKLQLMLILGALINGATFCSFTYMAPTLTDISGFDSRWIPLLLGLFGLGSFIGVSVGGRLADTRPFQLLAVGSAALLTGWIVFALTASHPAVTLVMLFVQGALSFAVGSTLISQVLYAADGAPTLGGSFATAAFNVGAALGPALGGLAIGMGLSYRAPLWTSAALVTLAIVIGAATLSLWRRPASVQETVPA